MTNTNKNLSQKNNTKGIERQLTQEDILLKFNNFESLVESLDVSAGLYEEGYADEFTQKNYDALVDLKSVNLWAKWKQVHNRDLHDGAQLKITQGQTQVNTLESTIIQKQAIEEIHSWDKQSLLMEVEAFICTMDNNQILDTIFQDSKEKGLTTYSVYFTDFYEDGNIGEAKQLDSFLAKNDIEAAQITKREFNIPASAVVEFDESIYFTITKGTESAFWCVEKEN